jgi:hypothetical protein
MKFPKLGIPAFVFLLVGNYMTHAQEVEEKANSKLWQKDFVGTLNLTQSNFDNWTQGGENSLAWQLNLKGNIVRDRQNSNWSNSGKFSFGRTKVGDAESRKSVDEIRLESVFTYKFGEALNPYIALSGETQSATGFSFTDDSKIPVSDFMDPGYFKQSLGANFTPTKEFKTRLGGALKETITDSFPIPYADDPETPEIEKTKVEPGLESVTEFQKKLSENIILTSNLNIFSNLESFDQTDVKWDNLFSAKVAKYIVVNLDVNFFYDRDLSKKRQVKESLSLGLTYSLL